MKHFFTISCMIASAILLTTAGCMEEAEEVYSDEIEAGEKSPYLATFADLSRSLLPQMDKARDLQNTRTIRYPFCIHTVDIRRDAALEEEVKDWATRAMKTWIAPLQGQSGWDVTKATAYRVQPNGSRCPSTDNGLRVYEIEISDLDGADNASGGLKMRMGNWGVGYTVLLHEMGHGLGLADTYETKYGKPLYDVPESNMDNHWNLNGVLTRDDIDGIRFVWARLRGDKNPCPDGYVKGQIKDKENGTISYTGPWNETHCFPGGGDNTCVDKNKNCTAWANRGECEKNPGYMLTNCCKSCDQGQDCHTEDPGHSKYCSSSCRCDEGEGDCDNDDQCNSGLVCKKQDGTDYCVKENTSCHTEDPGHSKYCSSSCRCDEGEGDCDNDAQCNNGLVCKQQDGTDYCVKENTSCHDNPLGHSSYCSSACRCDKGEGDCDNDDQCNDGLVCKQQDGTDYCVVGVSDCHTEAPGHSNYCSSACRCDEGEGDCDNDAQCNSGLVCEQQDGTDYCASEVSDCHTVNPGHSKYCSSSCRCDEGEGDCDSDAQCKDGLVCKQQDGTDYCVKGDNDCHTVNPGHSNYCSSSCRCDDGEGDCDNDAQCKDGLVCKKQDGTDYCVKEGNDTCTDSNSNCADWAARGECDKNPGYMLTNCCKSCQVDNSDKCPNDPDKTDPGECGCGVPEGTCNGSGLRFVVYGDSRTNPDRHRQVVEGIASFNPELVLHSGDIWDDYSSSEWRSHITRHSNLNKLLENNLYLVARGNHESESEVINFRPSIVRNNSVVYSLSKGNVFFVSLSMDPRDARSFLTNALKSSAAQNATWRVVFSHYPIYSAGSHGEDGISAVESICDQYGVDLFFSGHDHHYERSHQIKNDSIVDTDDRLAAGRGTVYVVTGGGGAPLYSVGGEWWTNTANSTRHYIGIVSTESEISVDVIKSTGSKIDAFTISQ